MATDITMPRLSDSMEEGTILKWLVSEGDEVKRGQEIAEIETDKANMTYESDTEGTLVEIVVQEGETVALGEEIGRAQTLQRRYPRGITDHVHLEIARLNGRTVNAATLIPVRS